MHDKETRGAVAVLQLNVEAIPAFVQCFTTAWARRLWKTATSTTRSKNYPKSLELYPMNNNAIEVLSKLQQKRR